MRTWYRDIPMETRERAVSLYVDNNLSLKGVSDALGLTIPITRKIILAAGVMRPHKSDARNMPHGLPENVPVEHLSYAAAIYDAQGGIYILPGPTTRYSVSIRTREETAAYLKSILIIGSVDKSTRGYMLYRISKQSDVGAFCTAIAPYSQNKRRLLYVAERINDVRTSKENKERVPTG